MKKFLVLLFSLITIPAYAGVTVEVQALSPFSSTEPPEILNFKSMEKVTFENGIEFEPGTVVETKIIDVKFPKRGKRNASFTVRPTAFITHGVRKPIEDFEFTAKYKAKKPLDKGELALSAASTVGSYFVKGFGQGISLAKGMVKNEQGNRLKSGVVQVYEDSPLAYIEKGEDLYIYVNDIFYLRFKTSELDPDEEETIEE